MQPPIKKSRKLPTRHEAIKNSSSLKKSENTPLMEVSLNSEEVYSQDINDTGNFKHLTRKYDKQIK